MANYFNYLSEDILLYIFEFLAPKDLCCCAQVCCIFNTQASKSQLWVKHCELEWMGKFSLHSLFRMHDKKKLLVAQLSLKADYSQCVKSLLNKELIDILRRRKTSINGLLERSDYVMALLKNTPVHTLPLRICDKWKASYAAEYKDAQRNMITFEELITYKWCIEFTAGRSPYGQEKVTGTFGKDFWWRTNFDTFEWCFYPPQAVRIGDFPPLTVKRTAKWSWVLSNNYVDITPTHETEIERTV